MRTHINNNKSRGKQDTGDDDDQPVCAGLRPSSNNQIFRFDPSVKIFPSVEEEIRWLCKCEYV